MALNFANNNSLSAITSLPASITGSALTLVSSQTASASASLEFSMDSTYDSYVFKFIDIHPATDGANFEFNGSIDNGSNYNVTKTTTYFNSSHDESDTSTGLNYSPAQDLAQSTSFQRLASGCDNDNDSNTCGYLQIFNPSSTTFVKHFICTTQMVYNSSYSANNFVAGYFNTTSTITNLKFQFNSGNIDDGIIKMYGVA